MIRFVLFQHYIEGATFLVGMRYTCVLLSRIQPLHVMSLNAKIYHTVPLENVNLVMISHYAVINKHYIQL